MAGRGASSGLSGMGEQDQYVFTFAVGKDGLFVLGGRATFEAVRISTMGAGR